MEPSYYTVTLDSTSIAGQVKRQDDLLQLKRAGLTASLRITEVPPLSTLRF
jgi:hypothetical protein